jgi:hypothetical protein
MLIKKNRHRATFLALPIPTELTVVGTPHSDLQPMQLLLNFILGMQELNWRLVDE